MVSESLLNCTLSIHGLFDAKAMGDLTEDYIPEESVLGKVSPIPRLKKDVAGRRDDIVELLTDHILEKDRTCAQIPLDISVKRKVQRDDLDTGIGLSGIIDGVA